MAMHPPKIIRLSSNNLEEKKFMQEVFGLKSIAKGWARERNRIYVMDENIREETIADIMKESAPPSILEVSPPPVPDGALTIPLFTQKDGTKVTWIRHPDAIPHVCRSHWRDHFMIISFENDSIGYTAFHAIHRLACVNGADGIPRVFAPGGIRWVDYPDTNAAICDVLDMSLAVTMKLEVVKLICAGSKVVIVADKAQKADVLRSLFSAIRRLGLCITAADLGLSTDELEIHTLSEDPMATVPIGVYRDGIPSGIVTAQGTYAGLKGMVKALPGSPAISDSSFAVQGLGEVGFFLVEKLVQSGAKVSFSEINPDAVQKIMSENPEAVKEKRLVYIENPDKIYDVSADIFCPCALRDILHEDSLKRFQKSGVKLIGGPANNLFTDQVNGPWQFQKAGISVIPYEGIGAGGVTGVSYSIMSGFMGKEPFSIDERIDMIADYVEKIIRYSNEYDLPAQVVSDRILFRGVQRRTIFDRSQAERFMMRLTAAYSAGPEIEASFLKEWTKEGFFFGSGRFPNGGWKYLDTGFETTRL